MGNKYSTASIFWIIILGAAIIAGLILMFRLLSSDKKSLPSKHLLAITLGLLIWFLIVKVILIARLYVYVPHVIGTAHIFWYIFGPLVYYSFKKYVYNDYRFSLRDTVHLYPLVFYLVIAYPFYVLNGSQKISAYLSDIEPAARINISSLFLYGLVIAYTFLCLKLITGSKRRLLNVPDNKKKIVKSWKILFKSAAGIYIFFALSLFILEYLGLNLSVMQQISYFLFALVFYFIVIKMLRNPIELSYVNILPDNSLPGKPKYSKSSFEKEKAGEYIDQLQNLMTEEKPYLKNNLTLPVLAEMMNLSTHHLSQLLNQELKMNFVEFINYNRIKEAQKLLNDPEYVNHTILAISFEVGFNSKTSFNRTFKKYTGMTPSEYLQRKPTGLGETNQELVR